MTWYSQKSITDCFALRASTMLPHYLLLWESAIKLCPHLHASTTCGQTFGVLLIMTYFNYNIDFLLSNIYFHSKVVLLCVKWTSWQNSLIFSFQKRSFPAPFYSFFPSISAEKRIENNKSRCIMPAGSSRRHHVTLCFRMLFVSLKVILVSDQLSKKRFVIHLNPLVKLNATLQSVNKCVGRHQLILLNFSLNLLCFHYLLSNQGC